MTTAELITELSKRSLTTSDLDQLRRVISLGQHQLKCQFRVGQQVKFKDRMGTEVVGRVIKIMAKNLKIEVANGNHWHVSPELCS